MMPTEQAADRVTALVERLRFGADDWDDDQLMDRAADALTALQARVGELEGALKPFAALVLDADPEDPIPERGLTYTVIYGAGELGELDCADFHRAALLTPPAPHSDEAGS